MNKTMKLPPNWGGDSLSKYIQDVHENRFATFVHKKQWFCRLAEIDTCFVTILHEWLYPNSRLTPLLMIRAHAAYRAACEHALAGQCADIYPQVRVALEYAAYASFMHVHPNAEETWLRRHDDKSAMKSVKEDFKIVKLREAIKAKNRAIAEVFDTLYQRAIDFGAHPNERAVTGNLSVTKIDEHIEYKSMYFHKDGVKLDHGLKTTAQAGACVLEIFQDVFSARFELLGVKHTLLELRRGL